MSTSRAQMANKSGGFSELKARLLFVLGALFVYRVGAHIPVPGIDPKALAVMFERVRFSLANAAPVHPRPSRVTASNRQSAYPAHNANPTSVRCCFDKTLLNTSCLFWTVLKAIQPDRRG